MNRIFKAITNFGYKGGTIALMAVMLFTMTVGLSGCSQSADITKVLNLLPTVQGITDSIGTIVAAADPAITGPVDAALLIVNSSFVTVETVLKTYQTNLNAAPATVLADLDAAVAAIQTNLSTIANTIPGLSPAILAALTVGLTALQTILGLVASLLPAPVAAAKFPKSYALLSAAGVRFGYKAVVPTPRAFAQSYNAQLDATKLPNAKKAHIHVPWMHVGPLTMPAVPVLP